MAGFTYKEINKSIVDMLKNYNTCTAAADLSADLPERIDDDNILSGSMANLAQRGDRYPILFTRITSGEEVFLGIGLTGAAGVKKQKDISMEIYGFYKKSGLYESHGDNLDNCYILGKNIENVLRENVTLSGTAVWITPRRTKFSGFQYDNTSYMNGVLVEIEGRFLFR